MKQELPTGVAIAIIVLVVLIAGFFLYRAWTGGTQGEGRPGEVRAAPPVPSGGAPPSARDGGN
jgi:hypothetical protein